MDSALTDVPMEGEEAPKRILYNMPDEMVGAEEDIEEEELPPAPIKEKPDTGVPPPAPSVDAHDALRVDALHLEGEPINQLSTSRLMAYVAYSGTHAKGIEWINDTRCVIVFDSYEHALQGLERLCYDPWEETRFPLDVANENKDVLLRPCLAMAFPTKLYNAMEQETASELPALQSQLDEARAKLESAAEPMPEIYRDMEMEEMERKIFSRDHRRMKQLRQPLWVRFALQHHDTKSPRSASKSNWYRQHGRGAGKEVVTRLLDVGDVAWSRRRRRNRGGDRKRRDGPQDYEEDYTPLSLRDRIGGVRRDRDWDDDDAGRLVRDRSASPDRGSDVRIRGRGSAYAPRSRGWDS